jgi:hypothetical protein
VGVLEHDDERLAIGEQLEHAREVGSTAPATVSGDSALGAQNPELGITYGGLEALDVRLGSGADTFTVSAVDPGTDTTTDAGPGDDSIRVGTTFADIVSRLLVRGGGEAGDTLSVHAEERTALTLDDAGASRGVLTAQGVPGRLEFEQILGG